MSFRETEIGRIPVDWGYDSIKNSLYIKGRIGWKGLKKTEYLGEGNYRIINGSNVVEGNIDWKGCGYISEERYLESPEIMLEQFDIIMTKDGTIGKIAIIKELSIPSTVASGLFVIRIENDGIDVDYLFNYLRSPFFKKLVESRTEGSVIPHLYQKDLLELKLPLPPLQEQKAIAHILSTLDEKIEVNNKINKTLEEMAQAIFKHWFVDFEFPNEDGEPYKSSGGEMVNSELGPIPKGWEVSTLEEVVELHDSKRVPLSGNFREKMDKIYPYYGAAALMDYVDNYIFDGQFVLLGEDGTVITDDGKPVLQYVWGKFWVNNHAHVVSGKDGLSINFIYNLLKNIDVDGIITGAVQKKINQSNLLNYKIVMPDTNSIIDRYSTTVFSFYEQYMSINNENKVLASIRDTLLPKLMSGEIRVPIENEQ
jgi:type I restriction enzyme S subunit